MNYQTIRLEKKDYITTITLNRPDRLNALTYQLADELFDAFASADRDDETRVVVLTGAGRAFSAGADLKEGGGGRHEVGHTLADRLFQAVNVIEKPVIASINGVAVGGGCTMTLSCDPPKTGIRELNTAVFPPMSSRT